MFSLLSGSLGKPLVPRRFLHDPGNPRLNDHFKTGH
jgi:hypothetical protein